MRDSLLEVLLEAQHKGDLEQQVIIDDFIAEQRAQGKLPVGAFGDIEFETNRVQAQELVEKLAWLCCDEKRRS